MIPRRLATIAALVLATGAFLRMHAASEITPTARLDRLPFAINGWRGVDEGRLDPDTERALKSDSYILRTFRRGPAELGLYVAFYAMQRSGQTIHSPLNCLPGTGWDWLDRGPRTIPVQAGSSITVTRALAQRDGDRLLIYYWYQSRGRAVADDYQNKLLLMRDALIRHRTDGALVRVVAPVTRGTDPTIAAESFISALYDPLVRQLPE